MAMMIGREGFPLSFQSDGMEEVMEEMRESQSFSREQGEEEEFIVNI